MNLQVRSITKRFGDVVAVDRLSITFEEQKIYGLLGRNGAGKTTLMNCITGRLITTEGEICVDGFPVQDDDELLSRIYMMSEKNMFPSFMKVFQAFKEASCFYGCFDEQRAARYAQLFGLDTRKRIAKLSTGYTSIFKLIIALSLDVPFILLDEPVLGLDANHRDLFYSVLLESYAENPRTFIVSTHLIEEIAPLAEEIVMIDDGKLLLQKSTEELLGLGYAISGRIDVVDTFVSDKEVIGFDIIGGLKTAYVLGSLPTETLPTDLGISKLDLQKLFIQLTNNKGVLR